MRADGAVRVKHGSYEVAFAPAPTPIEATRPQRSSKPLTEDERARYDDAEDKLENMRELGFDV